MKYVLSPILLPGFQCHADGSPAIGYAPRHQVLISAGKRGDVSIFDVRQRQLRHTFQAHDSPIRCMAFDPTEEYFITGAADGEVKVGGGHFVFDLFRRRKHVIL